MAKLPPFPLKTLRDRFQYDPETGHLSWLVNRSSNVIVGQRAGSVIKNGYRKIVVNAHQIYAHHVAWYLSFGEWPDAMIDHINGDRDDNRIANLRLANQSQQNFNTKAPHTNTSGHKGVAKCSKTGRWRAYITKDRKQQSLGNHETFDAAVAARKVAEAQVCGEFARKHP